MVLGRDDKKRNMVLEAREILHNAFARKSEYQKVQRVSFNLTPLSCTLM